VDPKELVTGLAGESISAIEARSASTTAIEAEQSRSDFAEPPALEIRHRGVARTNGGYHSMLPLSVTNRDSRYAALFLAMQMVFCPIVREA
jgi:hypothetical protein